MEFKTCTKCQKDKPLSAFQFRNKAKGIRHTSCTECGKVYRRKHYTENIQYYSEKAARRNKITRIKYRQMILEYLKEHPCVDCGEADPVVLQFDHVRNKKIKEIGRMLGELNSWDAISKEIEKCDVRCSNCHIRRTAKDFGWYKLGS